MSGSNTPKHPFPLTLSTVEGRAEAHASGASA